MNEKTGQEATVRTEQGKTNGLVQNWERSRQGCILSPCSFNLFAEHIMRNAGLDGEPQAGINTARRNINNLRNTDGSTLMAEIEEELKSLLMKVKEKVKKLT